MLGEVDAPTGLEVCIDGTEEVLLRPCLFAARPGLQDGNRSELVPNPMAQTLRIAGGASRTCLKGIPPALNHSSYFALVWGSSRLRQRTPRPSSPKPNHARSSRNWLGPLTQRQHADPNRVCRSITSSVNAAHMTTSTRLYYPWNMPAGSHCF